MNIGVLALALWSAQANQAATSVSPLQLSLDEAVRMALDSSFQLQRSVRNQRIADARVEAARAGSRPRIDVSIGADQSQRYYDFRGPFDYSIATPQFSAAAGVDASYDFDISGVRKRSERQAGLSQRSASVDVAQTALNTAIDARLAYVQALRAQQQVDIDQETLALIDRLIARARPVQPGVVDFLMTERSNSALILDQSRQSEDSAMSNLRQQLRLDNARPVRLTSGLGSAPPVPPLQQLLEIAYKHRSDVEQSAIRVQQARLAQSQASDYRRPSLRASAFVSHNITGDTFVPTGPNLGRARSAGIGLSFNLPIWSYDGGELNAARRIAAIQAEQALADTEEAKERARNEIAAELVAIERARARMEQAPDPARALDSLTRAEDQMLAAAPANAAALLAQVSNARQNWRSSITLKFDALTSFYSEYFRLQRSLGTDQLK